MKQTPDEILSHKILAEIEKKQSLSKQALEKLRASYLQGKVTPQEWTLAVDLSTEIKNSNDKQN